MTDNNSPQESWNMGTETLKQTDYLDDPKFFILHVDAYSFLVNKHTKQLFVIEGDINTNLVHLREVFDGTKPV